MIYESDLIHHGVKGMKWGVRRYQNPDGSYTKLGKKKYNLSGDQDVHIAKGSKTFRISIDKNDDIYDNKKYVSLSKKDNKRWKNYIGKMYKKTGRKVYSNKYEITNDLKIASSVKAGKELTKLFNKDKVQTSKDSIYSWNQIGGDKENNFDQHLASVNFSMQTKTGKRIVDSLLKQGYQGVVDAHGTNTGNLPIIIFNPEKNMKLIKQKQILKH